MQPLAWTILLYVSPALALSSGSCQAGRWMLDQRRFMLVARTFDPSANLLSDEFGLDVLEVSAKLLRGHIHGVAEGSSDSKKETA